MERQGLYIIPGDIVQLIDYKQHTFLVAVETGGSLHTHRGILPHEEIIGKPWGSKVYTHRGYGFLLIRPSLGDILLRLKRNSQIMYPKDIGYVLVNMGIGPGMHIVEAGTGSGSFTIALAYMVGATGKIFSYENRQDMQAIARANLDRLGLLQRVNLKLRDISEGFDEEGIDALFLDVPNPEDYLRQVKKTLSAGCPFGCLLPTTNQVSRLITALQEERFGFIEVCEIFLRYYKANPNRLRPEDRMVGHTGFLVFARPMAEGILPPELETLSVADPMEFA